MRVQIAAAQAQKASVLWLPSANVGADYIRHTGGIQDTTGNLLVESTNSFIAGGSAVLRVATTDAIFEPLAARQVLASRRIDTQTARNEAPAGYGGIVLPRASGARTYAAMTDADTKAVDLVRRVQSLAGGLVAPDEIDRARRCTPNSSNPCKWRASSGACRVRR